MAGRERRVGRGRIAACAFVLALSVLIAGGVYFTASPGDPVSDAGTAQQRALTGDATYAPGASAAPGEAGIGEASTISVAPEQGSPDASAPAPMATVGMTDTDVPMQVYGGEESGVAGQGGGAIVSQNDPATPQATAEAGAQRTGTARGLDARVTAPQTTSDETSSSYSSSDQTTSASEVANDSAGDTYAQDTTSYQGSTNQGETYYSNDEGRPAYVPERSTSTNTATSYVEQQPSPTLTEGVDYVSGSVIVNVDQGMSANQIADSLASAGVQSVDPSSVDLITEGVAKVNVTAGNSVDDALAEIAEAGAVVAAQPNYIYHIEQERTEQDLVETLRLDDLTSLGPDYDASNLALETQQEQVAVGNESDENAENTNADDTSSADATDNDSLDTQSESVTPNDANVQSDEFLATESEQTAADTTSTGKSSAYEEADSLSESGSGLASNQVSGEPASVDGTAETVESSDQTKQDTQQTQVEVEGEAKQGATTQAADQEPVAKSGELLDTLSLKNVVNDTYYAMQWGIESIDADEVWDSGVRTNRHVGVAVLDNGFYVNHEDLKDNFVGAYNAFDSNNYDVSNPNNTKDPNHGMHAAGIVGATANNNMGVAGVSYNAQVIPILVSDERGSTSTDAIVKAYSHILNNQANYNIRVVSMSLGTNVDALMTDYALFTSIDDAFNKGIVTVCSAGNRDESVFPPAIPPFINLPADYAPIVSVINLENRTFRGTVNSTLVNDVSYTDAYDVRRYEGSNYNRSGEMTKDISAPGTHILSTLKGTATVGDDKNVRYGAMSGTSMAAPHVAGVLALMFANRNYATTAEGAQQAIDTLLSTARPLNGGGFDSETGFGEVNALQAVKANPNDLIGGPAYVGVGNDNVSYSGSNLVSSDPSILSVTSTGQATPNSAGQVLLSSSTGRKAVTVVGPIEGSSYIKPNETATYTVAGNPLRWEWSVSDSSLASFTNIDPSSQSGQKVYKNGVLKAKGTKGIFTITAKLLTPNPGGSQFTLTKTIQIGEPVVTSARMLAGTTLDIANRGNLDDASRYTWTSSNAKVATVTASGVITAVGDGTAKVYAKNGDFIALEATVTVDGDLTKKDNSGFVFTVSQPEAVVYTGKAIEPSVTVTYSKNGTKLTKDTDYTLTYANNTAVGTATITVAGKAPFTGTRTVTFNIAKDSIADATVTGVEDATYTGSPITQNDLKVTLKDGTVLAKSDYEVTYANNVNVGTASFTVTAKNNYAGTKSGTFQIKPADASNAQVTGVVDKDYTGSPITQNPTVKVGTRTLTKDVDYTLSYENNKEPGTATVTVTFTKNYNGNPISETFEITANLAKATISEIPDQIYDNGKEIKPEPTVTLGSKTLNKGADYELDYDDNDEVGTATVKIKGIAPYVGEQKKTFKIAEADIKDATITGVEDKSYTGDRITQNITVTLKGKELEEGDDYAIAYDDNEDVGTATFTITATPNGNYTGSKGGSFKITPADASSASVTGLHAATYTGSAITQTPTVKLGDVTLIEDDDYEVETTDNVNVGNATVTITYMDNYTGETKAYFEITPANINNAQVSAIGEQTYTGSAVEPRPTVTFNGKTLVAGTDYRLSYSNQVGPGTATATIQGINNFTGTRTQSFEIVNPITRAEVTLPAVVDYTGEAVIPKPTVVVDGRTLEEGKDYVLVYNNNVSQGIATLTIQGIGEFEGTSKTVTFEIKELSQNGWSDNSNGQSFYVRNHDIATGWQRIGNNVFWLGQNGLMQTSPYDTVVGTTRINYFFAPTGALSRIRWSDPYNTYYATPYGNRLWMGSNGMYYRMNFNNGLMVPAYQYNPLARYSRLLSNGLRRMPYQTMQRIMHPSWNNPYIGY